MKIATSAGSRVLSQASRPPLPPLPPKPSCASPIDFALVLDESGSMEYHIDALKAFAKELVHQAALN